MRNLFLVGLLFGLVCMQASSGLPVKSQKSDDQNKRSFEYYLELSKKILDENVLVDGHNDLPYMLRRTFSNQFGLFDFTDIRKYTNDTSHTDLIRIKEGKLGAQFWVTYADCSSTGKDATRLHMEQVDTIKRLVNKHPNEMQFAADVKGIHSAFGNKKVASMIGLESGHAIDSSLAILRIFYNLGVRYMTLTHNCDVPWATNNLVDNRANASAYGGLTNFGRRVIQEMNRLGMLVDLSHTSRQTQLDALHESRVPVIYSHSSVYSICNHTRNVRDDVLDRVKKNKGVVMVNFYNAFVTCKSEATVEDVIDHINYIKNRIGIDHAGIGSDYDGVPSTPTGLQDVADYPNLFARLLQDGWSEEDVIKLAGGNLLRVLDAAEKYAHDNKHMEPIDDIISEDELPESNKACRSDF